MANYFLDSTTGNDADNGTTMDLAFATLDYAISNAGLVAGDTLWIRRLHSEIPASDISGNLAGTGDNPITFAGWPRAADATADGATWANGSTTVDLVTTLSMDREKHLGRYVTAPDGETYMITLITDANTFTIDREYTGASVTTTAGAFTIQADELWVDDMGTEYGFDDSGWTIKESNWDGDADDLPLIDFNANARQVLLSSDEYLMWENIDFHDSFDTVGMFNSTLSKATVIRGCLFLTDQNTQCVRGDRSMITCIRCVIVGSGAGANQRGVQMTNGLVRLVDCAVYNMGGAGAILSQNGTFVILENVNSGVEVANAGTDMFMQYGTLGWGRDVKLGGTNGLFTISNAVYQVFGIENYGKSLGSHQAFTHAGTLTKVDVVAGGGDPYKRPGGADSVLEVLHDLSSATDAVPNLSGKFAVPIFEHEFEASTDTKNYRYYVQAEGIVTASELWIECEYVSVYEDDSEYIVTKVASDEAFTARADAADWAEYLEVTGITPAVASKVRIKCYCSYYHATNKIYIDPLPEVT
jgi:hypothetical protein